MFHANTYASVTKVSIIKEHLMMIVMMMSHRKLQQYNYGATIASVARRQFIGGGAPINKWRRRPQIVGSSAAGARLYHEADAVKSI